MYLKGYHGDTSATFLVGDNVDEKGKALVECTRESLDMAIKLCGPNVPYKEIGRVIRFIQFHTFYFFFLMEFVVNMHTSMAIVYLMNYLDTVLVKSFTVIL